MAVTQTGDIMGVILNNIMHRDDVEEEVDDDEICNENSKFKNIVVLLDKIKREADVFVQYPNVNNIMEIKIVTVNDEYRGQGVCKALFNKTKYATKYKNICAILRSLLYYIHIIFPKIGIPNLQFYNYKYI